MRRPLLMLSGWRIVNARYAKTAFSGDGARREGGRWNSPRIALVYLAAHQSLAVLEILANARPTSPAEDYLFIPAAWEETMTGKLRETALPKNWQAFPPGNSTAAIGDSWVEEMRSVVLAVPNTIIPTETNYLINPAHPDFRLIAIGKPVRFAFDPRLSQR